MDPQDLVSARRTPELVLVGGQAAAPGAKRTADRERGAAAEGGIISVRGETLFTLAVTLSSAPGGGAQGILVQRSKARGPFAPTDLDHAARLRPHLVRAFGLSREAEATRELSEDLGQALDLTPHGIFVVDRDRRVRHANRVGRVMANGFSGLTLTRGRLGAMSVEADSRLQALVQAASLADQAGGSMLVTSIERELPLAVTVAPMRLERSSVFDDGPSVIVCVCDPQAGLSLPENTLQILFGLTPAEARVALALFEGDSPREASRRLGVSFNTVRYQLQQVYAKTGVSRQGALMAVLARVAGLPFNPAGPRLKAAPIALRG
jgi:DNA-binding CsgD family transcriptional regulator